jgi:hypothetical protein
LSLRIDLGNVEINRPLGDPAALWSMPSYPGWPLRDMGDPNFQPPGAAAPPAATGRPPAPQPQWQRVSR